MIFLLHFLFSTQSSLLMLMPFQIEGVLIFCAHIFLFFYSIMPHSQIILNESLKRRKDNGTFSLSLSFSVCACTCVRVCACVGGLDVCVCPSLSFFSFPHNIKTRMEMMKEQMRGNIKKISRFDKRLNFQTHKSLEMKIIKSNVRSFGLTHLVPQSNGLCRWARVPRGMLSDSFKPIVT